MQCNRFEQKRESSLPSRRCKRLTFLIQRKIDCVNPGDIPVYTLSGDAY